MSPDGSTTGMHGHDATHATSHESNPHEAGGAKHGEHAALFNLVPHAAATHVAVADGDWFDPATWAGGEVPGDDARVLIPKGVAVDYAGISDARLFTVRIDGRLDFATDAVSRMVVDTMVVGNHGTLTAGTVDDPVRADALVEIVIANNGDIDVAWDPMQLSRGVISHGTVRIHGEEKTTHLKVAEAPMAGDTSIRLAEVPLNWQVGDVIVLTGTRYDGYKWDNDIRAVRHYESEDEVLTISRIEGDTVFFETPLRFNHDTPREDLAASVANYSRNVRISTEDPETAAVHQRGHVMFMHNDDVDVRYAEFHELGRTDKSRFAFKAADFDEIAPDSNVQGRYSFHFHQTGVEDLANPAIAIGNAVFGSPGWGYVHHDSNAILHSNASYDTFGAGFVAETGNETGAWTDNIAIYAKGISWTTPKNGAEANFAAFDLGRTGDGFWFQGRMVDSVGNIAASVNTGFVYFHRSPSEGGHISFDAAVFDFPEALHHSQSVGPARPPILAFRDNEAFAARAGLQVTKANPNQGHDVHSVLENFTAWSVLEGADFQYTSHYVILNFDLIGKDPTPFSRADRGIFFATNTSEMTVVDARIDGFKTGMQDNNSFTFSFDPANAGIHIIGAQISNAQIEYSGVTPTADPRIASAEGGVEVRLDGPLHFDGSTLRISGVKIDGLGETQLPGGSDNFNVSRAHVARILETEGFLRTPDGKHYFILETYHTDRLTGEVYKFGHLVEIDPSISGQLQKSWSYWYSKAVFAGMFEPGGAAPVAEGESVHAVANGFTTFDLLANDYDPDGDAIRIDGITQPRWGQVFDNGDGTVTYRPYFGFTGEDSFSYWVTDGHGHFSRATVQIEVTQDPEDAAPPAEPELTDSEAAAPPPTEPEPTEPEPADPEPQDPPQQDAALPPADPAPKVIAQFGTVAISHNETVITLDHAFLNPVVFALAPSRNGGDPVTVRFSQIESDGFALRLQEPSNMDGWHMPETVSWMVFEAGSWVLGDGTRLEVGTFDTGLAARTRNDSFESISFDVGFTATPAIFTQIQTEASPVWTVTRQRDASSEGFGLALQREELQNTARQIPVEKVGWFAVEQGVGAADGLRWEATSTAPRFDHRFDEFRFTQDFDEAPAMLASLSSFLGSDTAALRHMGLTAQGMQLQVMEETTLDREIAHLPESVDVFAIEGAGPLTGIAWDAWAA